VPHARIVPFTAALRICRGPGERPGEVGGLDEAGVVVWQAGDYEGAGRALKAAPGICCSLGDRGGEAEVLSETGTLALICGEHEQAGACHQEAPKLSRDFRRLCRAPAGTMRGSGLVMPTNASSGGPVRPVR
jgi:hypothetical protein